MKHHADSEEFILTQKPITLGLMSNVTYVTSLRAQINFQNCILHQRMILKINK